jgi:glycosyltransferase involved in cell wall biosynthesis
MEQNKIKVVFVWRFLLYYRIDLFNKINIEDNVDFTLIHGGDIPNSKFTNYRGKVDFKAIQLKTLKFNIRKKSKTIVYWPSFFLILRKIKPDVIVYEGESNMINNFAIYFYSLLRKKSIIWWGMGLIPGRSATFWQRVYKPFKMLLLKHSQNIIAYSNYSKEYYSQYVESDKILVAINCLDNDKIDRDINSYRVESKSLKRSMDLSNKFVIIYVGALEKGKKVDNLIKSYEIVKGKFPECALIIIGGGSMEKELKDYVNLRQIRDVHFTGKIYEGISKYFLMADLFVLPGLGGLAIFEAMVYGLPVISASADGTERDLIKEGKNGYILKTDTEKELIEYIQKFLVNKEMSKSFGKVSREIIDNEINIQNKVKTFMTAIENSTRQRK